MSGFQEVTKNDLNTSSSGTSLGFIDSNCTARLVPSISKEISEIAKTTNYNNKMNTVKEYNKVFSPSTLPRKNLQYNYSNSSTGSSLNSATLPKIVENRYFVNNPAPPPEAPQVLLPHSENNINDMPHPECSCLTAGQSIMNNDNIQNPYNNVKFNVTNNTMQSQQEKEEQQQHIFVRHDEQNVKGVVTVLEGRRRSAQEKQGIYENNGIEQKVVAVVTAASSCCSPSFCSHDVNKETTTSTSVFSTGQTPPTNTTTFVPHYYFLGDKINNNKISSN